MTVQEMLKRIGSQEITDWAAIFSLEDEELKNANKDKGGNKDQDDSDDEDITAALIAAIDRDKEEEGII